jgi:hypothetical protein
MKFLNATFDPIAMQNVLLVQTCNPDLLTHIAADARQRFPRARLVLLLQKGMRQYLPLALPVDELIENPRHGKRALLRQLRAARFEAICLVESGEPGFWKLKMLPLLLCSRAVLVFDRTGRSTWFGLTTLLVRLGGRFDGQRQLLTRRRLAAPLIFLQCWLFYRRRLK